MSTNNGYSMSMRRRSFLKIASVFSFSMPILNLPGASELKMERPPWHGLKVGVASYSLRKFSLDQAIQMVKVLGLKYITLKDIHLPLNSSNTEIESAKKKIESQGLKLMGGGVIYINDGTELGVTKIFEYAKMAGMPLIVASPDPACLPMVEKLAKQFDIYVAIHNHGPGDKRYPSPIDVLKLIQKMDKHMGICMDLGHTVRLGEDPVKTIDACAERLYDFHIKDISEAKPSGKPVIIGRGVIDIPAVLRELVKIKFEGHVALEYELDEDSPLVGMAESIGYIHGVLDTID
jgi:sugar phosphate isomerase/epimerase